MVTAAWKGQLQVSCVPGKRACCTSFFVCLFSGKIITETPFLAELQIQFAVFDVFQKKKKKGDGIDFGSHLKALSCLGFLFLVIAA